METNVYYDKVENTYKLQFDPVLGSHLIILLHFFGSYTCFALSGLIIYSMKKSVLILNLIVSVKDNEVHPI
jgi:hypothetical protein